MTDQPPPRNGRRLMSAKEFHQSGLLYYVNSTVLWPLGLALAVSKDKRGRYRKRLDILMVEPAEVITDGKPDEADHPRYRAADTIKERLGAMKPHERRLARELLEDPLNVAAFLGDEPDDTRHPRPLPD